jgi:hypothetical protein
MKTKLFFVLALVALSCMLFSSCYIFTSNRVVLSSENIVGQEEADNAALYVMQNTYSEWGGAELGAPIPYYYVADTTIPIAYEYTVLKEGESVGYMIISACKDLFPSLEGGNGAAPSSYIDRAKETAKRAGYITDDEEPMILYWGALTYSVQFGDSMKQDRIAIHLPTGTLEKVPGQMYTQIDKEEAREAWNRLKNFTEKQFSFF